MADRDPSPAPDTAPATDATDAPATSEHPGGAVPTAHEDRERIEADEAHLKEVGEQIDAARATHAETEGSWLSGMIPEVEGHEGTGAADDLQT